MKQRAAPCPLCGAERSAVAREARGGGAVHGHQADAVVVGVSDAQRRGVGGQRKRHGEVKLRAGAGALGVAKGGARERGHDAGGADLPDAVVERIRDKHIVGGVHREALGPVKRRG